MAFQNVGTMDLGMQVARGLVELPLAETLPA